jgi:hypothetical protein
MTARMATLRANPWVMRVLLIVLAIAFVSALGARFGTPDARAGQRYNVPQDSKMEAGIGVRFTQAAVVGDGGLVELTYTVLDTQKASKFQSDVKHPPVIYSEKNRSKPTYRTALMRQGHTLRPGQTYFILYQNNGGLVKKGDTIQIDAGGGHLVGVPVR